jgi:hypothetical protein
LKAHIRPVISNIRAAAHAAHAASALRRMGAHVRAAVRDTGGVVGVAVVAQALSVWELLLKGRSGHYENWVAFLQEKHNKPISKDTWFVNPSPASHPR